MKEIEITLLPEEIESLLNMKAIELFEDEELGIKIKIKLEDSNRNILRKDILDRYDNSEYWNKKILKD